MAKRPVEKYDFKAFGEAIKAARTERKESRKKVSDEMFISPRYLANIENKGQHPSLQIFFELMLRYDISVDQFLLEKPDTKNTQRRQLDRNPNESIEFNDNSISAYLVQQGNCYVMGNRLNVHQMKCIRKIPVGEGGTDKHTNIAFISEEIWRAVMTEDISETIKIMKKFNMDDKQRRRFNRLRENYGLLPIKKR